MFKVGDKVKCIRPFKYCSESLKKDEIYTITHVIGDFVKVNSINDLEWDSKRFVLLNSEEEPMDKFYSTVYVIGTVSAEGDITFAKKPKQHKYLSTANQEAFLLAKENKNITFGVFKMVTTYKQPSITKPPMEYKSFS